MWQSEVSTKNSKGKVVGTHLGRKAFKIPIVPFYGWYVGGLFYFLKKWDYNGNFQKVNESEVLAFREIADK